MAVTFSGDGFFYLSNETILWVTYEITTYGGLNLKKDSPVKVKKKACKKKN